MKNSSFDLSPDEIRRLGYAAADAVADARARLTSRPVFGKVGADAALFDEPAPEEGQPIEQTLAFVREHILPFPMGNSHPRFFGFINATADPVGIAADYLASCLHPDCWGGRSRGHPRRASCDAVACGLARLPRNFRGDPGLGRLDGELHGARGGGAGGGRPQTRG